MIKSNFILPDFCNYSRNEMIILLNKNNIVNENVNIYSFYGSFGNAIFNGGRAIFEERTISKKQMKKVKKFYNKNKIRITLTFTNQCLEEKHLKDKYCNDILKIFHDGYNEILVASSLLEKYIRDKYPKYKINKSITATISDGNEDYTNYNLLVIDKKNNKNFGYLKSIKDKGKIEILCDETCVNDCKYTNIHYKEISQAQLGVESTEKYFGKCRYSQKGISYNFIHNRNQTSKYYIPPNMIKMYTEMGYKFFKLSGREKENLIGTHSIIDYLIKRDYQDDATVFIYERKILEINTNVSNGVVK